ncbi:hypothetical protein RUND412_009155 [Rhizina undulata]
MIMVEFDRAHNSPHRSAHYHPHQSHRGSPHLQHLEHSSAHSTPSPPYQYAPLSPSQQPQQQQQAPPARSTPTSYPSPASYPSPSISAYQYPPSQQPGSRGSPYAQPLQLPSLINLPPMRLNPPASQLPPPATAGAINLPLIGSPHAQPQQAFPAYYQTQHLPPPSIPHPAHITSSPIQPLRYQLPSVGTTERIMSGGRHKKEIKRRTKTGCLTCRKRRIKCDEAHPTCKNCAKSKRDCLGYDPIFKPQPGPAAIQPAPTSGGSAPSSLTSISSMSYHPSNSPIGGHGYAQTISTAGSSPAPSSEAYDYPSTIDPALESVVPPPPAAASLLECQATYRPELKRTLDRTSPLSAASDTTRHGITHIPRSDTPGLSRLAESQGGNPAKRIKIDDLLSVASTSQPLTPPGSEPAAYPAPTNSTESVKQLYRNQYAPSLDKFLETEWFVYRGMNKLFMDNHMLEAMSDVFDRLRARGGSYVEEEDPSIRKRGNDSNILWAAVKMCYGTRIPASDTREDERDEEERRADDVRDDEGVEALRRINIVEALVTGTTFDHIPSSPKIVPGENGNEFERAGQFWRLLGKIVTAKGGSAGTGALLMECEKYIDDRENRKLLFHIAKAWHMGQYENESAAKESKNLVSQLRSYIEGVAREETGSSLSRRIAGRTVGQWGEAITETSLYC